MSNKIILIISTMFIFSCTKKVDQNLNTIDILEETSENLVIQNNNQSDTETVLLNINSFPGSKVRKRIYIKKKSRIFKFGRFFNSFT